MSLENSLVSVRLHPSVVLSATRHVTHMQKCPLEDIATINLGILLGRTTVENTVDIVTSFETVFIEPATPGMFHVDWPAVKRKRERLAEVLPELCVVGWYGLGGTQEDITHRCGVMHAAFCEAFEEASKKTTFMLVVDAAPQVEPAAPPVQVIEITHTPSSECDAEYDEQKDHVDDGKTGHSPTVSDAVLRFKKIKFSLQHDEVACVGVDIDTNSISDNGIKPGLAGGPITQQIRRVEMSLQLLREHVARVAEYLRAVECGRAKCPPTDILRRISSVCAMLPRKPFLVPLRPPAARDFATADDADWHHTLYAGLFSLQTKCAAALAELVRAQNRSA